LCTLSRPCNLCLHTLLFACTACLCCLQADRSAEETPQAGEEDVERPIKPSAEQNCASADAEAEGSPDAKGAAARASSPERSPVGQTRRPFCSVLSGVSSGACQWQVWYLSGTCQVPDDTRCHAVESMRDMAARTSFVQCTALLLRSVPHSTGLGTVGDTRRGGRRGCRWQ